MDVKLYCNLCLGLMILAGALQAVPAAGQTNTSIGPRRFASNRWLLVVQTSASMKKRAHGVQRVAGSILAGGMNGQMRGGDTVGLWTFNDKLVTGEFPLQTWTSGRSPEIALNVFKFLKSQSYARDGRLDAFLPALDQLVKDSQFLTVVLISDGHEKLRFTPFDDRINAVYESWRKDQEQARLPFITVLRAQDGRFTGYSVVVPPWPFELPPLPAELAEAPARPAEMVQAPVTKAAPLILSGKSRSDEMSSDAAANTNAAPDLSSTDASVAAGDKAGPKADFSVGEPSGSAKSPGPAMTVSTTESFGRVAPAPSRPTSESGGSAAAGVTAPEAAQLLPARIPAEPALAQGAVAEEPSRTGKRDVIGWVVALAGAGLVAVILLIRLRSGRSSRVSLITRSLDRE